MRRAYSIIVVLAMMAMPLALLPAESGAATPMCNGICCRRAAAHSAAGQDATGMQCRRGPIGHALDCGMRPNTGTNCRIATLLAPTVLEHPAALAAPSAARRQISAEPLDASSEFSSVPFIPPRA
ncbi:MAG TPA: hypothetical protein VN661_11075 [Candidatus Acidoferrales bacterium]|nr:hypothetical protein [Candidatus Acidoferrales bacterium]